MGYIGTMQVSPVLQPQLARKLAMTRDLRKAIELLRLSNLELAAHLDQLAEGNRRVQVVRPLMAVMAAIWPPARGDAPPPFLSRPGAGGVSDVIEATHSVGSGLHDHARQQVGLLLRDPESRRIAGHFVDALEPSGWLGRPLAEVAQEAGCDAARAESVLARIQQAEPTGLFARDLAECLALQASEAGLLDAAFAAVLDNLPLLARGEFEALARLAGCDAATVRGILAAIRRLDPKPGARFDPAPTPLREPDLILRRRPAGWQVELNRSTLPGILVRDGGEGGGAELQAARWLEHVLARRNATLLAIGEAVVRRQADWLAEGAAALRPMRLADLAADCGLHESTISRAGAGLLLQTPQGMVGLRDLCGAGLARSGEAEPIAAGAVRHRIAALIAAEPPLAPLSDARLAAMLAGQGIRIARRTVAKYREQQGLPPASARLARARLRDAGGKAGQGRGPSAPHG